MVLRNGSKTQTVYFSSTQSRNLFELIINFEGKTVETSDLAKLLKIHVDYVF